MDCVRLISLLLMLMPFCATHATKLVYQHKHTHSKSVYSSQQKLSLKGAIHKAIEVSPELVISRSMLDYANGNYEQATAWSNPKLEIEAENFGGSGQFRHADSVEYTYGLSQLIELGGKISLRKQAAAEYMKAANSELVAKKLTLEREVHIAYANVLANEEALELIIEQEQLAKKVLQIVSAHVEAAKEPEMQKSKAEVAYHSIQLQRDKLVNLLEISKNRLAALIGEPSLNYALDHEHFFELQPPNSIKKHRKKLSSSPELQHQQHIIQQHKKLLKLEKAKQLPDPTIGVGMRKFKESRDRAYLLSFSSPIPIFNGNRGNIAKANAELEATMAKREQINLTLENQLFEHWKAWQFSYIQAKRLKTIIIPKAQKAFDMARAGYDKGNFPYVETLDAQRTLFEVSQDYYGLLKDYHLHRAWVEQLTASSN